MLHCLKKMICMRYKGVVWAYAEGMLAIYGLVTVRLAFGSVWEYGSAGCAHINANSCCDRNQRCSRQFLLYTSSGGAIAIAHSSSNGHAQSAADLASTHNRRRRFRADWFGEAVAATI